MTKISESISAKNNIWLKNGLQRLLFIFLNIFVISLPFNSALEWNWLSIARFEIKITMITFLLLFVTWLLHTLLFPRKRGFQEKLFYIFALLYASSQFISLINSPLKSESIKQAIIITCLLMMMIVVSVAMRDKKIAKSILTVIGTLSLIIGVFATINYYVLGNYNRLGSTDSTLGLLDIGGDPFYFGDILLYSIGAVFFVIINLSRNKYLKWLNWPVLLLWLCAIVLTGTKSLVLSVVCFFIVAILLLKGKRIFMGSGLILFILLIVIANSSFYLELTKDREEISLESQRSIVESETPIEILITIPESQKEAILSTLMGIAKVEELFAPELKEDIDISLIDKSTSLSEPPKEITIAMVEESTGIEPIAPELKEDIDISLIDKPTPLSEPTQISKPPKEITIAIVEESTGIEPFAPELKEEDEDIKSNVLVELKIRSTESQKIKVLSLVRDNLKTATTVKIKIISNSKDSSGDYVEEINLNPLKNPDLFSRLNILSACGKNSIAIRLKAITVSLRNSFNHFWFGNGAGLSQTLLPEMGKNYDKTVDLKTIQATEAQNICIYGYNTNESLIDSHVLFITEFFNVGVFGLISLICLIALVIREQIKAISYSQIKKEYMNELIFATLISMLVFRMAASLIVVPFLWFILGLSFGISKLYTNTFSKSDA